MTHLSRFLTGLLLTTALLGGCNKREPSADIFEAIKRKHFREAEVRAFVIADPSVVSATDPEGSTPLYYLAYQDEPSLVEFFIEQGADVNQPGYAGMAPLGAACHAGQLEVAKILLDHGADPNQTDDAGETPLHEIILWNPDELELFKLIVERGGRLDVLTKDGRSMLTFCHDRRNDYEDPGYTGAEDFKQQMLSHYDRLEEYILSQTQ